MLILLVSKSNTFIEALILGVLQIYNNTFFQQILQYIYE